MNAPLRVTEPSAKYLVQAEPTLLRGFELLTTAPSGMAKLRALIHSLAVRGLLVSHDPNDEPASVLIADIRAVKDRLIVEGKLRPDKLSERASMVDEPFVVPASWVWVRFGSASINRDGERVPVSSEIRQQRAKVFDYYGASGVIDKIDGYLFDKTLLLIGEDGANLINRATPIAFLASGKYWVNNHAHVIDATHPGLMEYLCLFINSISLEPYITGTAQPKMNQAKLNSIPVALPPLAEQYRIVARVEELMKRCDALEQSGRLADEQHARLTSTLFDALAASESAHALAKNWQRIAEHFDLLLDRPEAIDALEQAILQLGVRGLLVPQDVSNEPASGLVGARGDEYTGDGSLSVPFGWETVGFLDICAVGGGSTPSKARADFWVGQIPWVSPKDMKRDVITDSIDHVSELAMAQTSLSLVPTGSVLIVVRGMILAHSFPTAITATPVTINQDMKALTPRVAELAPYLALVCRGFKREILSMVERSTHGTCKLESSKLFGWRFGLPPLAEQDRIIARVEELRRLCAQLRKCLTDACEIQAILAEALVAQATVACPHTH